MSFFAWLGSLDSGMPTFRSYLPRHSHPSRPSAPLRTPPNSHLLVFLLRGFLMMMTTSSCFLIGWTQVLLLTVPTTSQKRQVPVQASTGTCSGASTWPYHRWKYRSHRLDRGHATLSYRVGCAQRIVRRLAHRLPWSSKEESSSYFFWLGQCELGQSCLSR